METSEARAPREPFLWLAEQQQERFGTEQGSKCEHWTVFIRA